MSEELPDLIENVQETPAPRRDCEAEKIRRRTEKLLQARQREQRALILRRGGASYAVIAKRLGITPAGAFKCVRRGISRIVSREDAETVFGLEEARLNRLQVHAEKLLRREDLTPSEVAKAIGISLRVSESRRSMLGVDAPAKIAMNADIQIEVDRVAVMRALQEILAEASTEQLDSMLVAIDAHKAGITQDSPEQAIEYQEAFSPIDAADAAPTRQDAGKDATNADHEKRDGFRRA